MTQERAVRLMFLEENRYLSRIAPSASVATANVGTGLLPTTRDRLSETLAARCHGVVVVDQRLGRLPDIEPLLHASTGGEREFLSR